MFVVHLLNDFSGSASIVNDLASFNGFRVITNYSHGKIDEKLICKKIPYNYAKGSSIFTIIKILVFYYHFFLFFRKNSTSSYLLSTILMAPLALLIPRKLCTVYLMELQHGPSFIFKLALLILRIRKVKILVLSESMKSILGLKKAIVVYPSLREEFSFNTSVVPRISCIRRILFIGSKKDYKGFNTFVELSSFFPNLDFTLVLNDSTYNGQPFDFHGNVFYNQKDILAHILNSDVVLNLSKCNQWRETFGLTIIEAMSQGRIVITPNCGAFVEYIKHGDNGFLVDTSNLDEVIKLMQELLRLSNIELAKISNCAKKTACSFEFAYRQQQNRSIIWSCL